MVLLIKDSVTLIAGSGVLHFGFKYLSLGHCIVSCNQSCNWWLVTNLALYFATNLATNLTTNLALYLSTNQLPKVRLRLVDRGWTLFLYLPARESQYQHLLQSGYSLGRELLVSLMILTKDIDLARALRWFWFPALNTHLATKQPPEVRLWVTTNIGTRVVNPGWTHLFSLSPILGILQLHWVVMC